MNLVKIAHISDLHFGAQNQRDSWSVLARQLLADNVDLVLVTGDIVDTPT